jgi:hypothetical protein
VNVALAMLLFAFLAMCGIPAEMNAKLLETGFIVRLAWAADCNFCDGKDKDSGARAA